MSQIYAELFGRVTRVITRGRGKENVFIVHTQTQNRDYKCICPFFCPIEEGDAIYAICEVEESSQLRVIKPPFVQIAMDRDSILRCFIRVLKGTGFGSSKANRLYELLAVTSKGSQEINSHVISYLSEMAVMWQDSKDDDILVPYLGVVSKEQMKKLLSWWYKNRSLRRLYLFGLTNREIEACRLPHDQIYERCLTNPYTLVGLSLEKCDEVLARQNKTGAPEDRRCGQMVRRIHQYLMDKAWTGIPGSRMLQFFPDISEHLTRLCQEYNVVTEGSTGKTLQSMTVYLRYPYMVEVAVAERFQRMLRSSQVTPETPMDSKNRESADFVLKTLTDEQKDAIQGALDSPLSVITAGGGCGKTLCIGEIVHNLELRNIPYVVASFTGKAVARVREVIKRKDPSTLHRLIARSHLIKKFKHLIIDEASMVTVELMYQFFKAFPYDYSITLVGDPHQLPPIGWGSLLEELLKAGCVPTFRLSQNHRLERLTITGMDGTKQELENGIMINANAIVNQFSTSEHDDPIPFDFVSTDNFTLIEGSVERVHDIIRMMYHQNVPADDLTIITPYNKDLDDLNKTYQEIYNEGNRSIVDSRGKLWMIRDRVMMLENNYDINCFNGENLTLVDIDDESIAAITKDGTRHQFKLESTERSNEDEDEPGEEELTVKLLGHAMAISVHKCVAQGTYVYTESGMRKIEELYEGIRPIYECEIPVHGRNGLKTCSQVYKGSIEPSIKIVTSQGFVLEGSHRHPILAIDADGKEVWRLLPELKIDDTIVLRRGMNSGASQYLSTNSYVRPNDVRVIATIPTQVTEELCYLLGVLVGDGNYTDPEYRISITQGGEDIDVMERSIRIVQNLFGLTMTRRFHTLNCEDCYIYNITMRTFLEWCGLNYVHSYDKVVPWVIFQSPLSCQAAFLSGLFDTDGGVNKGVHLTTTSGELSIQVHLMLLNFGIISCRSILKEAVGTHHTAWRIHISGLMMNLFEQRINFRCRRKRDLLLGKITARQKNRQYRYAIPQDKDLVAGFREEAKQYHHMFQYTGHPKLGKLISRIISGKSTLQDFHLKDFHEAHPDMSQYGPCGQRLFDLYTNGIVFDTITQIDQGTCQMYDLYMDDESHSFISNGIVSHNSQGSEWPYVVIYIPSNPANASFLNRNLIYTAITRAKRAVWCVGDIDALKAAATRPCPPRFETLAKRLNPTLTEVEVDVPEPEVTTIAPLTISIPNTLTVGSI